MRQEHQGPITFELTGESHVMESRGLKIYFAKLTCGPSRTDRRRELIGTVIEHGTVTGVESHVPAFLHEGNIIGLAVKYP